MGKRMKGQSATNAALGVIFAVIAVVIAVSVITNQAPTVAEQSRTSCNLGTSTENCTTALENAGITGATLAGTVYSFGNVLWALGFLVSVGLVAAAVAKKMGVL